MSYRAKRVADGCTDSAGEPVLAIRVMPHLGIVVLPNFGRRVKGYPGGERRSPDGAPEAPKHLDKDPNVMSLAGFSSEDTKHRECTPDSGKALNERAIRLADSQSTY